MPYPKSDVKFHLKDHHSSKVYTTSSPVAGDVTITTKREVPFDSIQILLLGNTKTTFDGMNVPQEVTHTFLKMMMPVPESTYPVPRVLASGHTYTIPFNFVIPSQLTIDACNHARLSDQMQDHHVMLPPTLGSWERDDMAPKMARVEYSIIARVVRQEGNRHARIMEASQSIQVLPASVEEPPLNITDKDGLYCMSKTKTLRKNLLPTKLGRLTAEATQPSPAVLSPDGRRVMSHPLARIKLSFTPESPRTLPPTITAVTSKITAHTYFASSTISSFPNLGQWNSPYQLDRRGQYFTSTTLPPTTLAQQPAWTPLLSRRDSGYADASSDSSSDSPPSPKTTTNTDRAHTTTLTIPLALPTDRKTFAPTFHSCIASRVYTVQLTVQLSTKGSTGSVSVVVPLQVAFDSPASSSPSPSRDGDGEAQGAAAVVVAPGGVEFGLPSFEEVAADEFLRGRVLNVLGDHSVDDNGNEGRSREWMERVGRGAQEADRGGLPEYGEVGYRRVE
jgi:hypothetical protein